MNAHTPIRGRHIDGVLEITTDERSIEHDDLPRKKRSHKKKIIENQDDGVELLHDAEDGVNVFEVPASTGNTGGTILNLSFLAIDCPPNSSGVEEPHLDLWTNFTALNEIPADEKPMFAPTKSSQ